MPLRFCSSRSNIGWRETFGWKFVYSDRLDRAPHIPDLARDPREHLRRDLPLPGGYGDVRVRRVSVRCAVLDGVSNGVRRYRRPLLGRRARSVFRRGPRFRNAARTPLRRRFAARSDIPLTGSTPSPALSEPIGNPSQRPAGALWRHTREAADTVFARADNQDSDRRTQRLMFRGPPRSSESDTLQTNEFSLTR